MPPKGTQGMSASDKLDSKGDLDTAISQFLEHIEAKKITTPDKDLIFKFFSEKQRQALV